MGRQRFDSHSFQQISMSIFSDLPDNGLTVLGGWKILDSARGKK
jgi:hypothetical protein